MTETVEQRIAVLEKEIETLRNESHKILTESAKAMMHLQTRLTSLRGPEGGVGPVGPSGRDGRDGLTEDQIRQIIEKYFQAHVGDAHKTLIAEINQFRKVVDYVDSTAKNTTLLASDFVGFVGQLEASLDKFVKAVGA